MTDKSWLLNPQAIQAARSCIRAVEQELGVKLKLSHPDFLSLLEDYCDLTESPLLHQAWNKLKQHSQITTIENEQNNILPLPKQASAPAAATQKVHQTMVSVNGHHYPKYNEQGQAFKGIYRGQPNYG